APGLQVVTAGRFQSGADDLFQVRRMNRNIFKAGRSAALLDGKTQQLLRGDFGHGSLPYNVRTIVSQPIRRNLTVSRSFKAHLLLVLMTLIWGSTFVLVKAALSDSSPLVFNAVRMGLAAVLLALYYRRQFAVLTKPALIAGVLVGVFLYLGYAF